MWSIRGGVVLGCPELISDGKSGPPILMDYRWQLNLIRGIFKVRDSSLEKERCVRLCVGFF